jgi:hypothetical protein
MADIPPLISLHSEASLIIVKLNQFRQVPTEILLNSLMPGQRDCLKTRPDGTILDGHHRIFVLQERGIDVNSLPREIIAREDF